MKKIGRQFSETENKPPVAHASSEAETYPKRMMRQEALHRLPPEERQRITGQITVNNLLDEVAWLKQWATKHSPKPQVHARREDADVLMIKLGKLGKDLSDRGLKELADEVLHFEKKLFDGAGESIIKKGQELIERILGMEVESVREMSRWYLNQVALCVGNRKQVAHEESLKCLEQIENFLPVIEKVCQLAPTLAKRFKKLYGRNEITTRFNMVESAYRRYGEAIRASATESADIILKKLQHVEKLVAILEQAGG
ncbi:MAG: hypothetical protein HW383_727 [Candidatus Magasanikbacteria bacterium]|nr:hypothetical protein [Candidatus Magasanikbacteria bacterium]